MSDSGWSRRWSRRTRWSCSRGSPIYPLYLRALGAKVGRGVVIFSRHVPVCADLLTVGDGTVVREGRLPQLLQGRRPGGPDRPGQLGRHVFVGEKTVLDIGTSLGDVSQLGHASSLHAGQAVRAGERWHGSPAQPHRRELPEGRSDPRPALRAGPVQRRLLQLVFLRVSLPVIYGGLYLLFTEVPWLGRVLGPG